MYIYLHMDINFACASRYIFAYMYKFPCAYTYIYMFSYTCQISLFCLETGRWLGPARSYLGWVFFFEKQLPQRFLWGPYPQQARLGDIFQEPHPSTNPPHPTSSSPLRSCPAHHQFTPADQSWQAAEFHVCSAPITRWLPPRQDFRTLLKGTTRLLPRLVFFMRAFEGIKKSLSVFFFKGR